MTEEDGYRLWLRYEPIANPGRRAQAHAICAAIFMPAPTPRLRAARDELALGLGGLLGGEVRFTDQIADATLIAGTSRDDLSMAPGGSLGLTEAETDDSTPVFSLSWMTNDAFIVDRMSVRGRDVLAIVSFSERGVIYGVFDFLCRLKTGAPIEMIASGPRIGLRMLDHWDNLDGSIERGYAGRSLWRWDELPDTVSPRIRDYARANASVGINAVALNNVNASAQVLTAPYLKKVAAIADHLRIWGIRVFLSARFSAPIEIGGLATADPLDANVADWWKAKAREIYDVIPDFGGLLVKANSEGQPGPQDYGRTHADGANMLADAVAVIPDAVVIWRAFLYRADLAEDRAKQAYLELAPLDGAFRANVHLQVKNGPIDFQPREPFHPLFGAMPRTRLMLELQLTQEYLGQGTHLAYLAPLFKEVLDADTHAAGPGTTVASIVDGSVMAKGMGHLFSGIAAVANVGDDRNWCGHPFAQANWYAYGRLAWDHRLEAAGIADEWIRMTFTDDERFVAPVTEMMLSSREAVVDYMTPLGLHHIMAEGHHHGPGPWVDVKEARRADWTSVYYHRADARSLGFDRTATGSDAVSLYRPPLSAKYANVATCPENLLLWFHHVPWDYRMSSGRTLWDDLCHRYSAGVDTVHRMQATWDAVTPYVDRARHGHVRRLLAIQEQEARWWRNACLLYFQTFSRRPLPSGLPPLEGTLAEYQKIRA